MTREPEHRRIISPLSQWVDSNNIFNDITREYQKHVRPVHVTTWQKLRGIRPRVITPAVAKMMARNDPRRQEAAADRDYWGRETSMMALVAIDATLARIEKLLEERLRGTP